MKTSAALIKLIVFMVVTSILTLFLAATVGNITIGGEKSYRAQFSDVTGLLTGNDVRVAGVRVGQVEEIELEGKTAVVTFSVDDERPVPESTIARLRYRNLVGERYIALTEGPGSADALDENEMLPLSQTRNALDLTVLFNGFRPLFQALDPKSTNEVAFEIIKTLQGEGGTIESLMARTASLTNTLADRDEVIGRVIDNLTTVLATLDDRGDQLSDLVVQLRRLSAGFAEDRQAIGESFAGIADLTNATASLLADVREPLTDDVRELGRLAGVLDDNTEVLDRTLRRLPPKLDLIIGTASYGSFFNFYLCSVDGRIVLPTGAVMTPQFFNDAARCQDTKTEGPR